MNGARTTYMRRGYLLTALAAAVLLAASSGTAYAQTSIGFTESSGSVAEAASLESGALEGPLMITDSSIRGSCSGVRSENRSSRCCHDYRERSYPLPAKKVPHRPRDGGAADAAA